MKEFRQLVDKAVELIKKHREISVEKLAYLLNVSPSQARYLMRAAADIDGSITYDGRKARYQGEASAAPAAKSG
jgi:orotate phosphoribosyltransferase-like protein